MKKRNFLVLLLAFVMVLCVGVLASCEEEPPIPVATTITLDASEIGNLKAGDTLDVSKLKITVGYTDETQKEIAVSAATLTVDAKAYNNEALTEGEHTIAIGYLPDEDAEPLTAEITINVGHAYGEVHTGTPATCLTAGTKDYYECTCGKKFVKNGDEYEEIADVTIPATGHDFEHGTEVEGSRQAATCSAKGKYAVQCANCTQTKEIVLEINPDAHDLGAFIKEIPATCSATGTKGHYDCSICNKHFDENGAQITDLTIAINANAHDFSEEWSKDEINHWHKCTRNGCNGVSDNAAHTFNAGEITTPATFDSKGVRTFTCTVCGQTKTSEIDKLEHNYSEEWSKDETNHWHACTDEGYETLKNGEAAHTFNAGEITTPATFDSEGVRTFTCTVCGQTKTESVDKIPYKTITRTVSLFDFTKGSDGSDGGMFGMLCENTWNNNERKNIRKENNDEKYYSEGGIAIESQLGAWCQNQIGFAPVFKITLPKIDFSKYSSVSFKVETDTAIALSLTGSDSSNVQVEFSTKTEVTFIYTYDGTNLNCVMKVGETEYANNVSDTAVIGGTNATAFYVWGVAFTTIHMSSITAVYTEKIAAQQADQNVTIITSENANEFSCIKISDSSVCVVKAVEYGIETQPQTVPNADNSNWKDNYHEDANQKYMITLPCIDFIKYKSVSFKMKGNTNIMMAIESSANYKFPTDVEYTVNLVYDGTKITATITNGDDVVTTCDITDSRIINGLTGVHMYAYGVYYTSVNYSSFTAVTAEIVADVVD